MTAGSDAAADIADQPDVFGKVLSQNAEAVQHAREVIAEARVVRLAGLGSSRHAAGFGAAALDLLAEVPATVLPAPGVAVATPLPRPDEPVIVLSQSGRTPALIDLCRNARDRDVAVIAVTNEPGSPLEELASVTLHCSAGSERIVAATKSVTAQCLLLRAVAQEVEPADLDALVDATHSALSLDVDSVVTGDPPGFVVVAGFAAGWVADEIALKVMEMCGISVASESVVDYFHGPRASGGSVLALLDPRDANSLELAADDGVVTIGPSAAFDLETPSVGESSLDALVALVVGQRIAAAWALHLGEDPDADRGLQKVTRTR